MSISVCFSLQALLVWRGSNECFSLFLTASLALLVWRGSNECFSLFLTAGLAGMARE